MGMNIKSITKITLASLLIGGITVGCSKRKTPLDPKDSQIKTLKDEKAALETELQKMKTLRDKAICEGRKVEADSRQVEVNNLNDEISQNAETTSLLVSLTSDEVAVVDGAPSDIEPTTEGDETTAVEGAESTGPQEPEEEEVAPTPAPEVVPPVAEQADPKVTPSADQIDCSKFEEK